VFVCFRSNECDIRIQLPQVGGEHCRLEVNENKEVCNNGSMYCLQMNYDTNICQYNVLQN